MSEALLLERQDNFIVRRKVLFICFLLSLILHVVILDLAHESIVSNYTIQKPQSSQVRLKFSVLPEHFSIAEAVAEAKVQHQAESEQQPLSNRPALTEFSSTSETVPIKQGLRSKKIEPKQAREYWRIIPKQEQKSELEHLSNAEPDDSKKVSRTVDDALQGRRPDFSKLLIEKKIQNWFY